MNSSLACVAFALMALMSTEPARAGTQFVSGDLRNQGNITGCGVGCTLSALDSDATWAQWAGASTTFNLGAAASVDVITYGYGGGVSATGAVVAGGGLEPYLSLFDSSGHFLASTFAGVTCPPGARSLIGQCFDVELAVPQLAAGSYTLVLTAFENLSTAENSGTGTLADGFTGLGNLGPGESLAFAYDISSVGLVPEPSSAVLSLTGVLAWACVARARSRRALRPHPRRSARIAHA